MGDVYLKGRCAWVTGGASGMGRAIALALAEAGADVAIGSLMESARDEVVPDQCVNLISAEELERTRQEIQARGVKAIARPLDVGSSQSVKEFFDFAVAGLGQIDILVNAAGSSGRHYIIDHPDELWDRMLAINLSGAYRTTKLCMPGMVQRRWGRIINIASTSANVGAPVYGAYCASKSGLLGLTRCVGLEGGPHGVTCNAINPGLVPSAQNFIGITQLLKIHKNPMTVEQYRQKMSDEHPQKRMIDPTEIGALAAFLCRTEAFGITAQDITVSGGALW